MHLIITIVLTPVPAISGSAFTGPQRLHVGGFGKLGAGVLGDEGAAVVISIQERRNLGIVIACVPGIE